MSQVSEQRMAQIESALKAAFQPLELEVIDDGHRHIGHAGARDGRGHFIVRMISAHFSGMPPLARHRAVYGALGEMMETDIHALSLKLDAPAG